MEEFIIKDLLNIIEDYVNQLHHSEHKEKILPSLNVIKKIQSWASLYHDDYIHTSKIYPKTYGNYYTNVCWCLFCNNPFKESLGCPCDKKNTIRKDLHNFLVYIDKSPYKINIWEDGKYS